MRITKGAPAFAGSPDTVSYLLSLANLEKVFSGTTWCSTGCCPEKARCAPTETTIETTMPGSIQIRFAMVPSFGVRLALSAGCTRVDGHICIAALHLRDHLDWSAH